MNNHEFTAADILRSVADAIDVSIDTNGLLNAADRLEQTASPEPPRSGAILVVIAGLVLMATVILTAFFDENTLRAFRASIGLCTQN